MTSTAEALSNALKITRAAVRVLELLRHLGPFWVRENKVRLRGPTSAEGLGIVERGVVGEEGEAGGVDMWFHPGLFHSAPALRRAAPLVSASLASPHSNVALSALRQSEPFVIQSA